MPQLAGAGWTHDTSLVSLPPGIFKCGLRKETQHLSSGGLFGCEAQMLPISRSALLENKAYVQRAARQSKVMILERIFLQNQWVCDRKQ